MSKSSHFDNGRPIHSFPMIPKEYEQYKTQEQYTAQTQYVGPHQPYQMRNSSCLYIFPNEQHQVANQNNFQVQINPVMSQQPQIYPFENQMMAYASRQNEQLPYGPQPSNNCNNPKPASVKRVRTQYTSEQLMQLECEFNKSNYLSRPSRIRLSQQLKLSEKQIKVWFQNRRMKSKKENVALRDRQVSSSPGSYRGNGDSDSSGEYSREFQVPGNFLNSTYSPNLGFQQYNSKQIDIIFSTSTHESLSPSDLYMPQAIVNSAQTVDELDSPTILLDESFSILALAASQICDN